MSNIKKWDEYFLNVCNTVASNSKCLSRKIGAILVKDKTIIGSGYNGPPRGIPRCDERWFADTNLFKIGLENKVIWEVITVENDLKETKYEIDSFAQHMCPRQVLGAKSGEMLDICIAGHAERNTLINSARMGIQTKGCKLYMACGIPCAVCMIEIINAGIEEIIVTSNKFYDKQTKYLLENSNVKMRLFSHLKEELGYSK